MFSICNICCRLNKVVAKGRARVYFEQQILALLLVFHMDYKMTGNLFTIHVFHQTHNLSRNKFARALVNQPISAPHLFNPEQMFLLRVKLIAPAEKRETSTKTCNETMLRDKLRVIVSRISPPFANELLVRVRLSVQVIFQKRVRVFHRGFKHEKTDESTRPQAECFYCFRVLETPMKHEARVFEITSPTKEN